MYEIAVEALCLLLQNRFRIAMHQVAWHIPSVGSSKTSKCMSRIRSGGVVISKSRIKKRASSIVDHPKLRIAGLPNRKAGTLKKG